MSVCDAALILEVSDNKLGGLIPSWFHLVTSIIFVLALLYAIILHMTSKARRELQFGDCNLPTVVWRPRFVNYDTRECSTEEDNEIDLNDEMALMAWAEGSQREDNHSSLGKKRDGRKAMGSSSITNILPRMERLDGPYGMYATVYGVRTKVVHVAHPVPSRAILTGAGTIDVADVGECSYSRQRHSGRRTSLRGIISGSAKDAQVDGGTQPRRRSSAARFLTGSTKSPAYDHFKNFSGDGVFTADGADWKAKRASVLHCLIRNSNIEETLEAQANRSADCFEREVKAATLLGQNLEKAKSGRPSLRVIDVVPMLQRSTVGLIYRLITHHEIDFSPNLCESMTRLDTYASLRRGDPPSPRSSATSLERLVNSKTSESGRCCQVSPTENDLDVKSLLPTYLDSVTKIRMIILAQSRSFWYLVPRWMYRLLSPMYREEEKTMKPIRNFALQTCKNAKEGSPLDLMRKRASHSGSNAKPDLVSKDLLDEAITLLFAGQDTSAATLSWTLHLLSLHPEKQQKLADEIKAALDLSDTRRVSKNIISQMPYLDAVIKESMRLYPVAPFIVRKLTSDITIPNDSSGKERITLPAATFACIWIYAIQRNPRLWHQPEDFLPERWIDSSLRRMDLGQSEYGSYIPFAIGPRNCLGQPLAHVVLRVLLARIVDKFRAIDPRYEALTRSGACFDSKSLRMDMQAGFTVLPSNGLRLRMESRL